MRIAFVRIFAAAVDQNRIMARQYAGRFRWIIDWSQPPWRGGIADREH
jgi:hypothetical protein